MTALRPYGPEDRPLALAHLRRLVAVRPVPFSISPGDWNWWQFHADPRVGAPRVLIGDRALVELTHDGELNAFGLTPDELFVLVDGGALGAPVHRVAGIGTLDTERETALAAAGFAPVDEAPMLSFERPISPADPPPGPLPDGYRLQPLDVATQVESRADAARLAFRSTMDPDQHRARYRGFTRSPGYPECLDLVAVAPDGAVAAFTVFWPDDETSTVQLEPVGTHPDHVRRGLARTVILAGLARMAARGIRTALVCTEQDRHPASDFYPACGFSVVDRLRRWERSERPA